MAVISVSYGIVDLNIKEPVSMPIPRVMDSSMKLKTLHRFSSLSSDEKINYCISSVDHKHIFIFAFEVRKSKKALSLPARDCIFKSLTVNIIAKHKQAENVT